MKSSLKLVALFELFEYVIVFELFDRPSTFRINLNFFQVNQQVFI